MKERRRSREREKEKKEGGGGEGLGGGGGSRAPHNRKYLRIRERPCAAPFPPSEIKRRSYAAHVPGCGSPWKKPICE